jgi:lipoprotein signal peptidase
MTCQNSNGRFNNRIKFKFNYKIYIKIMRCKIVRFQKLMWRNMIRSTKSKKVSVLHYSIDMVGIWTFGVAFGLVWGNGVGWACCDACFCLVGLYLRLIFALSFFFQRKF